MRNIAALLPLQPPAFTSRTMYCIALDARGVPICKLLLHVGYGTFQPIRSENIEEHAMEPEYYSIDAATAAQIQTL